jgi:hypothetical protein
VKPKAGFGFKASSALPVECQYQQVTPRTSQNAATILGTSGIAS